MWPNPSNSNWMRLQKPSGAQRSPSSQKEQFVKVEDAPVGRGSPRQAACAPCYGPDGSSPALSKAIHCFPTVEIVPDITSPNQCPAHTGPSWDLPTTSPLLFLLWGMESCDFSRAEVKSPSVLSSHESFYLRKSVSWAKRLGYTEKDRGTRENQKLQLMNKISAPRLCSK